MWGLGVAAVAASCALVTSGCAAAMSAAADSDSSAGSTPAAGDAGQNGAARSVAAGSGQSGGQPVQVTVSVSGDHLIHGPVYRRAAQNAGGNGYNFKPMFKQIKPFKGF